MAAPFANKAVCAALGKKIINNTIPRILKSDSRASAGVENAINLRGGIDLPKLAVNPARDSDGPSPSPLTVRLVKMDTLDAANLLLQENPKAKVAVLNMASPTQPGGGVLSGARAQEESLCLRSTLYPSLKPEWYRHKLNTVIYTPDVLVFKGSESTMETLDAKDRFYVDVITVAAMRRPETVQVEVEGGGSELRYGDTADEEMMTVKIKYIMRVAVKMGITHLVLGAFGCGAFKNPVAQVAAMMRKQVLGKGDGGKHQEDWRAAGLEEVVFAILDDSPKQLVWGPFQKEFEGKEHVTVIG